MVKAVLDESFADVPGSSDVEIYSIYAWRTNLARARNAKRRERKKAPPTSSPPPLRFAEVISAAATTRYELALPNGVRLLLEEGFTDEAVGRLLTLAQRC